MRMKVLAGLGILVMGGTVLVATAQERPRRAGREGRADLATLQKELGLTAEQAAQMQKAGADGRKQAIRQRADLAIARLELEELMAAPVVDQKAIDAKVAAISGLEAAGLKARTDQRLALRKMLTPEQQEKMKQLMRENRGPRGARPARSGRERRPGSPGVPPPGQGGPSADETDDLPSPEPLR